MMYDTLEDCFAVTKKSKKNIIGSSHRVRALMMTSNETTADAL